MEAFNIPITDHEMDNLYHGIDPQDTSTESTIHIFEDSVIAQIVNNWESHIHAVSRMHTQTDCNHDGRSNFLEHKYPKSKHKCRPEVYQWEQH